MVRKVFILILAIAVLASLSLFPALIAASETAALVIGKGDVTGDPNFNFNSLPATEGIYGVKLDSTDENWKSGISFQLPDEPVMMYAGNKSKSIVDESFDFVYVVIKAGAIQSGGGDWVFVLNQDGEFDLLSSPTGANDHYTVTISESIITVTQTDRSDVKDVSHISFFFRAGEEDEESDSEESDSEESSSEDSSSEDSSSEDSSSEDSSSEDSSSEDSSSEDSSSEDSSSEDSSIDESSIEDSILDDFEEETTSYEDISDEVLDEYEEEGQPDTATTIFRFLIGGLLLLAISSTIIYFQRKQIKLNNN